MASGAGGQLALIKEGSLYHSLTSADLWQNFVSEGVTHNLEELEEGSITGRRDAPPSHKGIDFSDGDIEMEPNPNAIGHWLKGAMGTITSSIVTQAGSTGANSGDEAGKPYVWHEFRPRVSAYSARSFLEPYGLMIYRDVGSAFFVNGTVFPKLEFDIQAGQLVKATAGIMGRDSVRINRIAAIQSLVSSGGRPWVWDMASIEVSTNLTSAALAVDTNFEQLTITLETPVEGVVLLDGNKQYAEFQANDFRRVNFSGTMSFRDHDAYNKFTAYENVRVRATLLNVNSQIALGNIASLDGTAFLGYYGMRFHFPRFKYLSWGAPIGGPNRLQATFTAKAEYDDTEGVSMVVEVNNVTSGQVYTGSAA